jgi:hypothetical protein
MFDWLKDIEPLLRYAKNYLASDLEVEGSVEQEDEAFFKIDLKLINKIKSTLVIKEIRVMEPEGAAICPLAGVRENPDNDIPDKRKLSSFIVPNMKVRPKHPKFYRIFLHSSEDLTQRNFFVLSFITQNLAQQKKKRKTTKIHIRI